MKCRSCSLAIYNNEFILRVYFILRINTHVKRAKTVTGGFPVLCNDIGDAPAQKMFDDPHVPLASVATKKMLL